MTSDGHAYIKSESNAKFYITGLSEPHYFFQSSSNCQ